MKSRIGTINKKPIVQGDKNLVTPNEIHVSELKGGGGGQADIPVEYYKIVPSEELQSDEIVDTVSQFPCFHVLIKGTSTSASRQFTGIPIKNAITLENLHIHSCAIGILKATGKTKFHNGTIAEIPSFNNIFDAIASLEGGAEALPIFKEHLVPITAEEFYSLDDLK